MNPFEQFQVLEMSSIECPVCNEKSWALIRNNIELANSYCLNCKTTVWQIFNHELEEQFIEWFRGHSI